MKGLTVKVVSNPPKQEADPESLIRGVAIQTKIKSGETSFNPPKVEQESARVEV
jgi:hypothetical protein